MGPTLPIYINKIKTILDGAERFPEPIALNPVVEKADVVSNNKFNPLWSLSKIINNIVEIVNSIIEKNTKAIAL